MNKLIDQVQRETEAIKSKEYKEYNDKETARAKKWVAKHLPRIIKDIKRESSKGRDAVYVHAYRLSKEHILIELAKQPELAGFEIDMTIWSEDIYIKWGKEDEKEITKRCSNCGIGIDWSIEK